MANLLYDPEGLAKNDLDQLDDKIRAMLMNMARNPSQTKAGAPFIYVFALNKKHIIKDISSTIFVDDNGNKLKFGTVATDGKNYYWHPDTIRRNSPIQLGQLMIHETYHIICDHASINRVSGRNRKIWNIAVDYCVNSLAEHDYRQAHGLLNDHYDVNNHPIFNGTLGKPLLFDDIISTLKQQAEMINKMKNNSPAQHKSKTHKRTMLKMSDMRCYADYKGTFGKNPEELYETMMKYAQQMEEDVLDMLLEQLGGQTMDDHQTVNIPKSQLLKEILDAAVAARPMSQNKNIGQGSYGWEEELKKLLDPVISWQDLVRNKLQRSRQDKGAKNDWSRLRRRSISLHIQPNMKPGQRHPIYIPKKKDDFVSWLALLDTSGSMSNDDMCFGVSQLKVLDSRSEGLVVCCDAETYWDKAVKIHNMSDLPKIKGVGRGGTVFKSFFEEYRKKVGDNYDLIIILTDGGIFDLEELKKPRCDVVWILTNEYWAKEFKPPFGRVAKLRAY